LPWIEKALVIIGRSSRMAAAAVIFRETMIQYLRCTELMADVEKRWARFLLHVILKVIL
jgi:hypothetical protein